MVGINVKYAHAHVVDGLKMQSGSVNSFSEVKALMCIYFEH